jgi:hypothetical protein
MQKDLPSVWMTVMNVRVMMMAVNQLLMNVRMTVWFRRRNRRIMLVLVMIVVNVPVFMY